MNFPTPAAAMADAQVENPYGVELGRLGEFVGFRLRRLQNQLSRDFAASTASDSLRSGLFSSLAIIAANPGISQNEVSRAVGLDKSVTVQIVDELEKRGLAERQRSKVDRRRHALFITDAGSLYLDGLFGKLRTIEETVLGKLKPGELVMLKDMLDRMYESYSEAGLSIG